MKVFISWSGTKSKAYAEVLKDWLPNVLQSAEPFMSAEDIGKGARWSGVMATHLETANFGIICVSAENMESPWINFEAGALSKSLALGNVSPLLFGVKPLDLKGPLAQFQATELTKSDVSRLVFSINAVSEKPIDAKRLEYAVEQWWPTLESATATILQESTDSSSAPREIQDMVEELLNIARSQQRAPIEQSHVGPAKIVEEFFTNATKLNSCMGPTAIVHVPPEDFPIEPQILAAAMHSAMSIGWNLVVVGQGWAVDSSTVHEERARKKYMNEARLNAMNKKIAKDAAPE